MELERVNTSRSSHPLKRMLIVGVLGGLCGCQSLDRGNAQPAPSVASAPAAIESPLLALGQTAELPTYRIKLVSQRDCDAGSATAPRRATRSWAVELEITNIGSERIATSPFYATIKDDQKYSYTTSLADCTPLLPAKMLEPKETVRGYVPFQLPSNTPNVTLSYHPVIRGNASHVAQFRIEL